MFNATIFLIIFNLLIACNCFSQNEIFQNNNILQYHNIEWQHYANKKFGVIYENELDTVALKVMRIAPHFIKALEDNLLLPFAIKPQIIIYSSIDTKAASNVGLLFQQDFPTSIYQFKNNRILLAYEGDVNVLLSNLYLQLADLLLQNKLYGGTVDEAILTTNQEPVPSWFANAAAIHASIGWQPRHNNAWKQLLMLPKPKSFDNLLQSDASLSGIALLQYISQVFGKDASARFIYQTVANKSISQACSLSLKKSLSAVQLDCLNYFVDIYLKDTTAHYLSGKNIKSYDKPSSNLFEDQTSTVKVSGKNLFYLSTSNNKIYLRRKLLADTVGINTGTILWQKSNTDSKMQQSVKFILSNANPQQIAIKYSLKGVSYIDILTLNKDVRMVSNNRIPIKNIDGIQSVCFSYKPNVIAFSAFGNGQTDIYELNIINKKITQLTNNIVNETNLSSFKDAFTSGYLFLSDNLSDTFVNDSKSEKLSFQNKLYFIADADFNKKDAKVFKAISLNFSDSLKIYDIQQGYDSNILIGANYNGIKNAFVTTLSQNEFSPIKKIENLKGDLLTFQSLSSNAMQLYSHCIDSIFLAEINVDSVISDKPNCTYILDSLQELKNIFHFPKSTKKQIADSITNTQDFYLTKNKKMPLQFAPNYMGAALDNSLLISKYQPFLQNQGQFHQQLLSGLATYSFADVLENHQLIFGIRIPSLTKGGDVFIKYNNYKENLDWGVSYFRHVEHFTLANDTNWFRQGLNNLPKFVKQRTHYTELYFKQPFNIFNSLKWHIGFRKDEQIFLATDKYSLEFPSISTLGLSTRVEYEINRLRQNILDNKITGFKFGVFGELHAQPNIKKSSFVHTGFHFQNYLPINKSIVFANRIQSAFSYGDGDGIMYTLGGITNPVGAKVDSNVNASSKDNYLYIAYASGLRGYAQNSKVGNGFYLCNTEIRVKMFPNILKFQTNFNAIKKMQLLAFTDIANAWKLGLRQENPAIAIGLGLRTVLAGYYFKVDCAYRTTKQAKFSNPMFHFGIGKDW
jgi:hypothetical protein